MSGHKTIEVLGARIGPAAARDPANVATDLVLAYLNRAVGLHEQGHARRDDVDVAMRLGCGLPNGPLAQLDHIGLDNAVEMLESAGIVAAPMLHAMIRGGQVGRAAGRGFYHYDGTEEPDPRPPSDAGPRVAHRIGVVGSGLMARGIAQVTATAGLQTTLVARTGSKAAAAVAAVDASMASAVARGRLDADAHASARGLLTGVASVQELADADVVIEAVVESPGPKADVFASLGRVCRPGAVLATTTSSLPVSVCAAASGRPADVVGMHFFNPAPVMRLVEVARTAATDDSVVAAAHGLAASLGKVAVDCPDRAGFIVNYLLFPYLNDAVSAVERGHVGIDDLDDKVRLDHGYPMGPMALLDTIGLDVTLAILRRLHEEFGAAHFAPRPLLLDLVAAGKLGRKTGQGFKKWPPSTGVHSVRYAPRGR